MTHSDTAEAGKKVEKVLGIRVSMDGLRRNLARSYIDLVEMLNDTLKGDWPIDKQELADKLLSLRQDIGILHCIYSKEEEQFSDLSDETKKLDCIRFTPVE